jgi:predicted MFS family arabinose efflux permease
MALQMGSMNAMRIVAPAAIGFLIFLIGLTPTYLVAVAVYGLALAAMTRVHPSFPAERAEPTTLLADIGDGVRYLLSDKPVRTLLMLGLVPMLLAMPFQALLVVFAEDVWDVGARGLGILQAAAGLGGLAGALLVARYGDVQQKMLVMLVTLLGFAASLLFFAMSPYFFLALGLVLLADVFASVFQTLNNTVIQVLIPDEMRGRVLSLMMMSFGLTPLGTLLVSIVAESAGAPVAVAVASVLTAAIGILMFAMSSSLRQVNELAAEREARPIRERIPVAVDI